MKNRLVSNYLLKLVKNPYYLFCTLGSRGHLNWLSDKRYLELVYRGHTGKVLDLSNPRTFNEKLQWLKINDRNPLYAQLVDKYAVKEWVARQIGSEYVVPTLGVFDTFDEIRFEHLPDSFVLKCTHDSGSTVVCSSFDKFNVHAAREKLNISLSRNYFWYCREWPYKNVKPRIIAEKLLKPDECGDLKDYKLFSFSNGRIITLVCGSRKQGSAMTKNYFDENWNLLEIKEGGHPNAVSIPKPVRFEEMKRFARLLSSGLPFCRVDFYESEGRLFFGEITFYPAAGLEDFEPESIDSEWGSWIDLRLAGGGVALDDSLDLIVIALPIRLTKTLDCLCVFVRFSFPSCILNERCTVRAVTRNPSFPFYSLPSFRVEDLGVLNAAA